MSGLPYVLLVWIATRAAVFAGLLWHGAHAGPGVFATFDGQWYEHVATVGYEYAPDGRQHDVAFFPLYPLAVAALMHVVPLPFTLAGPIVNNVAFLVAMAVVYRWVGERCDVATARWTVATLCIVPVSLYASLAYSEGLFMAMSAAALYCFDRKAYVAAGIAAGLASATRSFGILFFPAFALAAYREKRGAAAYLAAALALGGAGAYSLYCGVRFGDPLAYVHAQRAWRSALGFDFADWEYVFAYGVTWEWPYQLAILALGSWWLRRRTSMQAALASAAAFALGAAEVALWGKEQLTFLFVFLGGGLVVRYRARFGVAATAYALAALAIIVFSGKPFSAERLAFGIVPLGVALGMFWRRFPAFGAAALAVTGSRLPLYALRYAAGFFID